MWPSLFAESVSRNSCLEWDAVSAWDPIGKVCPTIQLDSGMYFPVEDPLGKCVPLWGLILGRGFRLALIGKVHPISRPNYGTQFPVEDPLGKCVPVWALKLGWIFRMRA